MLEDFLGSSSRHSRGRVAEVPEDDDTDEIVEINSRQFRQAAKSMAEPSKLTMRSRLSSSGLPQERPKEKGKGPLKEYLARDSTSTSLEQTPSYQPMVDFSQFVRTEEELAESLFQRSREYSSVDAGFIEFGRASAELPVKAQRVDTNEKRKILEYERKKEARLRAHPSIRPMKINLQPYQVEELKEAYAILDNGHEVVDASNVTTVVRACGFEPDNDLLKELLTEIKPANEDYLTCDEFIQLFLARLKRKDPIEEIRRAFRMFDITNTDSINLADLKEISKMVGIEVHEEELKEMIRAADPLQTGEVTMDNFVKLMNRKEYFD